ncbi:MAG: class I SAM-dependent methyltransferase, partial [Rhodospirillales bacterium]
MDSTAFQIEALIQQEHWWFFGRRRLFSRLLLNAGAKTDDAILDIGTSTGSNLRMLRNMGCTNVTGVEKNEAAIKFCIESGFGPVRQGDVSNLPFDDCSFDFVLATDIIEHVENDKQALAEIYRVMKPGGYAIISVPAFQ